jgi:DNA-binding MarR family transcriptional regulator
MTKREKLLSSVEERVLALILRANRARIYEDLLRDANVRMDKALYPVLSAVGAVRHAQVSQIAAAVGLNPTTASRHLASLERMALIRRSSSEQDGRASLIELTKEGEKVIRELRRARRQLFAELLAGFDDNELEGFGEYLDRLFRAFRASGTGTNR